MLYIQENQNDKKTPGTRKEKWTRDEERKRERDRELREKKINKLLSLCLCVQ